MMRMLSPRRGKVVPEPIVEVPFVFPAQNSLTERYVLNDATKRLRKVDASSTAFEAAAFAKDSLLCGSASVSELDDGVLLTTCALEHSPGVLSVALSENDRDARIELDVTSETSVFSRTVKIQGFSLDEEEIQLVLVDSRGTILALRLDAETLKPADAQFTMVELGTLLGGRVDDSFEDSEITSTMAAFLSHNVVCIARSPYLITVDIQEQDASIWSETQCLEDMKASKSYFRRMTHKASDVILGKFDDDIQDMQPTAAICVSSSSSVEDPSYVFTLHSDAIIRRWRVDPDTSLDPLEVAKITSNLIPSPSLWTDTHNSIYLCARLYERVFALVLHLQTAGGSGEEPQSDCRLIAISGLHDDSDETPQTDSVSLHVPSQATALVGLEFLPNAERCTLAAMFQSVQDGITSSFHATYPHSLQAILSSKPEVAPPENGLDFVAQEERNRISRLVFLDAMQASRTSKGSLDEDLHELDKRYMKYLFRPAHPRGTGTVLPPSATCIRRALVKLVRHKRTSYQSIELETLNAMHKWRLRDKHNMFSPLKSKPKAMATPPDDVGAPVSIYESYVSTSQDEADEQEEEMEVDGDFDQEDDLERDRTAQVEEHDKRWRRLLLQVWEEEKALRTPLCLKLLESSHKTARVIVRAGVTCMATNSSVGTEAGHAMASLDKAALAMLKNIETDKSFSHSLQLIEQRILDSVAAGTLYFELNIFSELIKSLMTGFGSSALSTSTFIANRKLFTEMFSGITAKAMLEWLSQVPRDIGLVASQLLEDNDEKIDEEMMDESEFTAVPNQAPSDQVRHAACSVAVRAADSIRHLQQGRLLLVLGILEETDDNERSRQLTDTGFRAYVHAISVLWTMSQWVKMPPSATQNAPMRSIAFGDEERFSTSARKLTFEDSSSSILAPDSSFKMTTAADASLLSMPFDAPNESFSLPTGRAKGLWVQFVRSSLMLDWNASTVGMGSTYQMLHELATLPPPSNKDVASDYPLLALRLIASFASTPLDHENAEVVSLRRECLAECLLIESFSTTVKRGDTDRKKIQEIACSLLYPEANEAQHGLDTAEAIGNAFEHLEKRAASLPGYVDADELARALQQVFYGQEEEGTVELRYLCSLATAKALFSPLLVEGAQNDNSLISSVKTLVPPMLHLSNLLRRLVVLDRHVGTTGGSVGTLKDGPLLLKLITDSMHKIEAAFPKQCLLKMPEYTGMWSRLFHCALVEGDWQRAYSACSKDPVPERRVGSFRRLVIAMVDGGALEKLIVLATSLSVGTSPSSQGPGQTGQEKECIDLYEVTAETLVDAFSVDFYAFRAYSPGFTNTSDYQGALYALHCSLRQWRRSAQAMDLRYVKASEALAGGMTGSDSDLAKALLREGFIIEDLVLSSVGAANAIALVDDKAERFIVSTEFGPYPSIPFDFSGSAGKGDDVSNSHSLASTKRNRLSLFASYGDLEGRAVRSTGLRALFLDGSMDSAVAKSTFQANTPSMGCMLESINHLFSHGYYTYGLLLAGATRKAHQALTGSTRPDGRDIFYDAVSFLLCNHLVPIALFGVGVDDEGDGSSVVSRPSMSQLLRATADVGSSSEPLPSIVPECSKSLSMLEASATAAAAMLLLRKLILAYSNAENSIAVEVANSFLDISDDCIQLPVWLERHLTGADAQSIHDSGGLFSIRSKQRPAVFRGDPSALVSIYMRKGMYVQACNVITRILNGSDQGNGLPSRETKAPSRCPEEGDIDFVPYNKIDMLWNLIDSVIEKDDSDDDYIDQLKECRRSMEQALEKHFELMKISELGVRSARALRV